MIKSITMTSIILLIIVACSNTPEQETGEIATFKLIKEALISKSNEKNLVDARNLFVACWKFGFIPRSLTIFICQLRMPRVLPPKHQCHTKYK